MVCSGPLSITVACFRDLYAFTLQLGGYGLGVYMAVYVTYSSIYGRINMCVYLCAGIDFESRASH